MRTYVSRLTALILVMAAVFTVASAGQIQSDRDLTATPLPRQDVSPTPTPVRQRPVVTQSPSVIEAGRIYEGNLSGTTATFLLNAELGQFFVLSVTTEEFDSVLEVYDAAGTQVARDDDGGPGNMPQLVFIAPSTGQFTVVVKGYSDPVTGGYILRATTAIESIPFGAPTTVTMDGETTTLYAFEATSGDVINLSASSSDTIDSTLRLLGTDGSEIGYVDDFSGVDPEFRRLPLTETGRYYFIHAPYSTSAVGDVVLLLEKTELSTLNADPIRFTVEQSSFKDIFNLEVEEGVLYLVTLTTGGLTSGTLDIASVEQGSFGSVNFTSTEGASMFFRGTFTGTARLSVSVNDSSGVLPLDVWLSVRAAE